MDDYLESAELMRDFAERGSHEAFRMLVDRYLPVVYGAAVRRTENAALAEDVTQLVFTDFAVRIPTLRADNRIGAWLHRAATMKARDVMKSEFRRKRREQVAANLRELDSLPAADAWREISPAIDEAITGLRHRDREAIILRFHEDKSLQEVGSALGITANAAQKRINRALQKLRAALGHRGITAGAVLLGSLIAYGTKATTIPAGLGVRISTTATTAVPSTGIAAWWYRQGLVSSYVVAGAALTLICGLIPLSGQWATPRKPVTPHTSDSVVETAAPQPTATEIRQTLSVDEIIDELGRILDRPLTSLNKTRCRILVEMIPYGDIGPAMEAMDGHWTKSAKLRAAEMNLFFGIAPKWAKQDPSSALNWVVRSMREFSVRMTRKGLLERLLRIWASQDWDAAWNWTRAGIEDGSLLEHAHKNASLPEAVMSGIGDKIVKRAGFRAAVDLTAKIQSGRGLRKLADDAKTPEDFSYYMAAAQSLGSASDRSIATSEILDAFRQHDWATANEWVKSRPPGWERAYMGWALGFPNQGSEQSSLPVDRFAEHADGLKTEYLLTAGSRLAEMAGDQVVGGWMKQDPQAAVDWIFANEDFPIENYGVKSIWIFLHPTYNSNADLPEWRSQAARLVRRLLETNREAYDELLASALSTYGKSVSRYDAFIDEYDLHLEPGESRAE